TQGGTEQDRLPRRDLNRSGNCYLGARSSVSFADPRRYSGTERRDGATWQDRTRSQVLGELGCELHACTDRVRRGADRRNSCRIGNGDQPCVARNDLSCSRNHASDPAPRLGTRGHHLLADHRGEHRVRDLSGAFFTVVLNVLGGARNIDVRYLRAARSLGSRRRDIFFRIVLPATLPSIFIGMAVGMGITWEVVVAAEMIAGKSGLGYLTWSSYVGGNYPLIVIGMISIGIAGYVSSS